jgi:hypothetical protein
MFASKPSLAAHTHNNLTQAKAVQEHVSTHKLRVDVVLVSPLTRALETAVGCFGNHSSLPRNGDTLLMQQLTAQPGVRSAHPAVAAHSVPPFVAMELCREHLGVHPCDKRRPLTHTQALFPGAVVVWCCMVCVHAVPAFAGLRPVPPDTAVRASAVTHASLPACSC